MVPGFPPGLASRSVSVPRPGRARPRMSLSRPSPGRTVPRPAGPPTRSRPGRGWRWCSRPRRRRTGGLRGPHELVPDEPERDHDGRHAEHQHEPGPAVPRRPLRHGLVEQLVEAGRGDRPGGPVGPVVLLDQRLGVSPDDLGDVTDVPPGVEVAAACRVVIGLDTADDQRPDPGLLADLRNAESCLVTGLRQGLADAHAAPPLPSGPHATGIARHSGAMSPSSPLLQSLTARPASQVGRGIAAQAARDGGAAGRAVRCGECNGAGPDS